MGTRGEGFALPSKVILDEVDEGAVAYTARIDPEYFFVCRFHKGDHHGQSRGDDVGAVRFDPWQSFSLFQRQRETLGL